MMLQVDNVSKSFGGVRAVDDVSIRVERGQIVGLIGTNGAGKTSLFNVVSGFHAADRGSVSLEGESLTGLAPYAVAQRGLVRTFQTPVGFPRMTVLENLLVFARGEDTGLLHGLFSRRPTDRQILAEADAALVRLGLMPKRNVWAQDLSAPELKMLEIGRAMMAAPKILLLDEPAAGVNPASLDQLAEQIRALRDRGVTFLIVDHNLKFICDICDYIFAMADGKLICEGEPDFVVNNEAVIDCYIGKRKDASSH